MVDVCDRNIAIPPDPAHSTKTANGAAEVKKTPAESPTIYTFDNFPISRREIISVGKYKLELVNTKRTPSLLVRLKHNDNVRGSILQINASDKDIRKAAKALDKEFSNSNRVPNPINYESIPFLNAHSIVILEKESLLFPTAVYYCELCSHHLVSVIQAKAHIEGDNHADDKERLDQRKSFFKHLPTPSSNQKMALSILILKEAANSTLKVQVSPEEPAVDKLKHFVVEKSKKITEILQEAVPDKELSLYSYGSVEANCDTIQSNVNFLIDLKDSSISKTFLYLNKFYRRLQEYQKETNEISNVLLRDSISSNITFTMDEVEVVLSWKNYEHRETSRVVEIFTLLCESLSNLLRFVRRWASIAGLDNSNKKECGFIGYVLDYMVIHFLQRGGHLPHLKDIFSDYVKEDSKDEFATYKPHIDTFFDDMSDPKKKMQLQERLQVVKTLNYGALFLDFLKFTVENKTEVVQIVSKTKLLRKSTKLKITAIQVHDPYGENIAVCSKAFQCFFLNCFLISFAFFSIPQRAEGPLMRIKFHQKLTESPRKKKTKAKDPQSANDALSEKIHPELKRNETPTRAVRTLGLTCITVPSAEVDDEIERLTKDLEKLQESAKVSPITTEECVEYTGPQQYPKKAVMDIKSSSTYELNENVMSNIKKWKLFVNPLRLNIQRKFDLMQSPIASQSPKGKPVKVIADHLAKNKNGRISSPRDVPEENPNADNICFEEFFMSYDSDELIRLRNQAKQWKPSSFHFVFNDPHNYNHGYCPELKCTFCDKLNHSSNNCPLAKVGDLKQYPLKSKKRLEELDALITCNYDFEKLSATYQRSFYSAIESLSTVLTEYFKRKVKLEVFGSLVNGFGTKGSDLDVCFTFSDSKEAPTNIQSKDVIKQIYKALIKKRYVSYITRILMAKVPIVKFLYRYHQVELQTDISYYNCLATHNTRLLKTYCVFEPHRVPQLGLWVKKFAKICDIGDASRGSLSSYSYIIMLIHYLQNCEPPVLPRLQEDFKTENTLPTMVEGWDVYFHYQYVRNWSKNSKTVGELFLGFLDYFSGFNYKHKVIQIRRKEELLKMEKRWNKPICIEDPFDLSHNLGNVCSPRMFVHIRQCFIEARNLFNSEETRDAFCASIGKDPKEEINDSEIPSYMEFTQYACDFGNAPSVRFGRHRGNWEENNKQTPRRQTQEDAGQTNVKDRKTQTSTPNRRIRNKKNYNRSALNPNQVGVTQ